MSEVKSLPSAVLESTPERLDQEELNLYTEAAGALSISPTYINLYTRDEFPKDLDLGFICQTTAERVAGLRRLVHRRLAVIRDAKLIDCLIWDVEVPDELSFRELHRTSPEEITDRCDEMIEVHEQVLEEGFNNWMDRSGLVSLLEGSKLTIRGEEGRVTEFNIVTVEPDSKSRGIIFVYDDGREDSYKIGMIADVLERGVWELSQEEDLSPRILQSTRELALREQMLMYYNHDPIYELFYGREDLSIEERLEMYLSWGSVLSRYNEILDSEGTVNELWSRLVEFVEEAEITDPQRDWLLTVGSRRIINLRVQDQYQRDFVSVLEQDSAQGVEERKGVLAELIMGFIPDGEFEIEFNESGLVDFLLEDMDDFNNARRSLQDDEDQEVLPGAFYVTKSQLRAFEGDTAVYSRNLRDVAAAQRHESEHRENRFRSNQYWPDFIHRPELTAKMFDKPQEEWYGDLRICLDTYDINLQDEIIAYLSGGEYSKGEIAQTLSRRSGLYDRTSAMMESLEPKMARINPSAAFRLAFPGRDELTLTQAWDRLWEDKAVQITSYVEMAHDFLETSESIRVDEQEISARALLAIVPIQDWKELLPLIQQGEVGLGRSLVEIQELIKQRQG